MGISDERKVATIANDETTILGIKATIALQIPIKFCVSHAMTAKKSAKKCTAFRIFVLIKLLLFIIFSFPSSSSWLFDLARSVATQNKYATISFDDLMRNARQKRRPQVPIQRSIVIEDHYKTLN